MAKQELMLRDMVRAYIRVTPEMEERVLSSYGRTGSYEKTAQETNVDVRRVRYIVHDRPRLGRDSSSLKERALELIRTNGPYVDSLALYKDMPGAHGLHSLIHILHSLHKAQLIDFREERSKTGGGTNYLGIRVRSTSPRKNGKDVRPTSVAVAPTSEEVERALPPMGESPLETEETETDLGESKPSGQDYPELARLIVLEGQTSEGRAKASKYLAAAEAVADIDPAASEELMRKAADVDGPVLTVVEQEYVRYAKDHPRP